MANYQPPIQDFLFLLYDVFQIEQENNQIFADCPRETVEPILLEAGKLATNVLAQSNKTGDREGCKLESGSVKTPQGFKEAFDRLRLDEWPSLNCDPEFGGQGLPLTIATAVGEFFGSANVALYIYHVLSHGVYSTIKAHGTPDQKDLFLPNLVKSKWTGTMNLTEPQCGTDLGMIRTKAVPKSDGTYKISGQKIYISAGDHDLSENIIHLVLARIPGSPDGVKGISLFIVPKYLTGPKGEILNRNNVSVGKVENKMGIHGNATCVMDYDEASGYLLGIQNKGIRSMFTMMNEARHAVGMQGLSQAEIAYQYATQYAKERVQGKPVNHSGHNKKREDTIISHPDVRRMLLEQKSFIEGARAFAIWSSIQIDRDNYLNDEDSRGLVSLLVPIFKAFLSDKGFESTVIAQQVLGGQGYIEESEMSQFVRDARIAMIYEGTNGIQAIDLVGRKLSAAGGKYMINFIGDVQSFIKNNQDNKTLLSEFIIPLKSSIDDLEKSLDYFLKHGLHDPTNALSGATDFLHLCGHVILGFFWSQIAKTCVTQIEENCNVEFNHAKLVTGKFYMSRSLPETKLRLARILTGKKDVMDLEEEFF